MGYSAADERFTHQFPRPFDEVHHPDGTWSDRCYFFAAFADGTAAAGQWLRQQPQQPARMGYVKVTLADGRHWDLMAGRRDHRLPTAPTSARARCAGHALSR